MEHQNRRKADPPGKTLSPSLNTSHEDEMNGSAVGTEEEVVYVENEVYRGPSETPLFNKNHDVLQEELTETAEYKEPPDLHCEDLLEESQRAPPAPVRVTSTPPTTAGAYRLTKTRPPGTSRYKVRVPPEVRTGMDFPVLVPSDAPVSNGDVPLPRRIQVTCPLPEAIPESREIEIEVPHAATYLYHPLKAAQLTKAPTTPESKAGRAFPMLPLIQEINHQAHDIGATTVRTLVVTIPEHAVPGRKFIYKIPGVMRLSSQGSPKPRKLNVLCPIDRRPGDRLRVVLPAEMPESEQLDQTFHVIVPDGVAPGGRFAVEIGSNGENQQNQQVLVDCPMNAQSGDTVALKLPTQMIADRFQALSYPSTAGMGWKRTVRPSDLHFQWVRLNDSIVETRPPPDAPTMAGLFRDPFVADRDWKYMCQLAYVRKLVHWEGNDPRLRTASLTLVPAESASVQSNWKTKEGDLLFSYADIAYQQAQPLAEKHEWFLKVCQNLTDAADAQTDLPTDHVTPTPGSTLTQSIRILVRRDHLLFDSLRAVLSLSALDMRRDWKIEFIGESGEDEGGLTKEWFQCLTEQLFLPTVGLFVPSCNNQAAVDLNPVSDIACPNFHLYYYRFTGRVLGRALFSGHLIKGHFVRLLYKYMLGWPVTADDIRDQDSAYFSSLHDLAKLDDENLSCVSLDFTLLEVFGDVRISYELTENGSDLEVDRENLSSYIEANIRYRLFDRTSPQLTELLIGFYDVVPEEALTVFDASELELLLCGLPHIDLDDWKSNTLYLGLFEKNSVLEPVVQWFWEIVAEDFDIEMQARLLQFVTGTSGVPPGGFAALKGGDDYLRKFAIQGVDCTSCLYPKAHTCFNVLDIPNYATKQELKQRLSFSITTSFVGFEAE